MARQILFAIALTLPVSTLLAQQHRIVKGNQTDIDMNDIE
jgi:hypothetical protein